MKFTHSLLLNSVPEWLEYYVDYSGLKKSVYQVEHLQQQFHHKQTDSEHGSEGYHVSRQEYDDQFRNALDKQLEKIGTFFKTKEHEVMNDLTALCEQYAHVREILCSFEPHVTAHHRDAATEMDDPERTRDGHDECNAGAGSVEPTWAEKEKEDESLNPLRRSHTVSGGRTLAPQQPSTKPMTRSRSVNEADNPHSLAARSGLLSLHDHIQRKHNFWKNRHRRAGHITDDAHRQLYESFQNQCHYVFISLSELRSYLELNRTAFDKILKKWDKVALATLRQTYFDTRVRPSYPFTPERLQAIDSHLEQVQDMYAAVFTDDDRHGAAIDLKLRLRDHICIERNGVWTELVGQERRQFDAHLAKDETFYQLPILRLSIRKGALINILLACIGVALFAALLCSHTLDQPEASRCLALLFLAAYFWAFECIPLYATAYLVPLLIVPLDVLRSPDGVPMSAEAAAKAVFGKMFSGTVMVLLGGFAMAAALSKHGIAKAFASRVLSKAGSKPRWVLLVNMYLAAFLSMWISNVATPVLCFSLVQPILRTLPPGSSMAPCLILGIALASCIGGLASPIASPQNIITIDLMDPNPGWGLWFAAAIPITLVTILTTWGILLFYFQPGRETPPLKGIQAQKSGHGGLTWSQAWVCLISLLTIALWCTKSIMAGFWGDNGVIAALPIVLFFATDTLTKTDLNNFLWSVVILAQGGMALGFAVESSGLLDLIGHRIAASVQDLSLLSILFVFGVLVLVFSTFVSHTVAALILLPIVKQVGQNLPVPHPNLLVMTSGLVCSVAMGLPVSGFPNMNAIMQEDRTGKPYLKIKDFILCGVPSSIIATLFTLLLGYGIISGIGY